MRGDKTLRLAQSAIADTLALKASSWFRQNLARGESTGCPLLVSGVRHLRLSANMGHPPVSSRTTRKDSNTLPSNDEAHTRPQGALTLPATG